LVAASNMATRLEPSLENCTDINFGLGGTAERGNTLMWDMLFQKVRVNSSADGPVSRSSTENNPDTLDPENDRD
jgi:hypothetical protein